MSPRRERGRNCRVYGTRFVVADGSMDTQAKESFTRIKPMAEAAGARQAHGA